MPGRSATPTAGTAWVAAAHPDVVSWSVSATTSSPAAAATPRTASGESVPSEAVECTCRSMRTVVTLRATGDTDRASAQAWGQRAVRELQELVGVPGVPQLELLQQDGGPGL